jgi:hypothetical protein
MSSKGSPPIGLWALMLGLAGFCAGFFGPILLSPEANQGPLTGIFITGPGGAAAGLALGTIFRFIPMPDARRWFALFASVGMLVIGTLFFCLPEPERVGTVVEGTIAECQSPEDLADAAIDRWTTRVANAPWAKVRGGWQKELPNLLRANTGVVLTFDVARTNSILKRRKPWNRGRIDAQGWTANRATQTYFAHFAGTDCTRYSSQRTVVYLEHGQRSDMWPPNDLPNLLDLATVTLVPAQYAELAR